MGDLKLNGATSGTITLTPTAVAGTNTITLPASTGTVVVSNSSGNASVSGDFTVGGTLTASGALVPSSSFKRNRIINGNMVVDQRYGGSSLTVGSGVIYTLDRWFGNTSAASKFSVQQNAGSVTPPSGFANYLGVTSLSAYSVAAGDYFAITQCIEGYNVADLGWGAAGASTITISFWVRSSLTGTFGAALNNSGAARSYAFSYTISSADTWEKKTVTIAGDTSGTWLKTNTNGIQLNFGLGAGATFSGTSGSWTSANYVTTTGATSVVGTNGATFYVTGVQFEVGSAATPYEMQIYSDQLAQCQRYYYKQDTITVWFLPINIGDVYRAYNYIFPVTMRSAPTCVIGGAASNGGFQSGFPNVGSTTKNQAQLRGDVAVGAGNYSNFTDFTASAEL